MKFPSFGREEKESGGSGKWERFDVRRMFDEEDEEHMQLGGSVVPTQDEARRRFLTKKALVGRSRGDPESLLQQALQRQQMVERRAALLASIQDENSLSLEEDVARSTASTGSGLSQADASHFAAIFGAPPPTTQTQIVDGPSPVVFPELDTTKSAFCVSSSQQTPATVTAKGALLGDKVKGGGFQQKRRAMLAAKRGQTDPAE